MLDSILGQIRQLLPTSLFKRLNPAYHWTLSLMGAIYYGFPSREIKVIAVTGTKGKSSTTEIINAILEEAGRRTMLSNTIRFKVADASMPNLYKMSMPGRFVLQGLLRRAVDEKCTHAVIEMTSQGALLYRHRWIELDTLVFTNLSPEHIEAHGSYEAYTQAKLSITRNMERSHKPVKTIIANADDAASERFLACTADRKISYSLHDIEPYEVKADTLEFTLNGRVVHSPLSGRFNLYNILAAITAAKNEGVSAEVIIKAVESFDDIPGRVEKVEAGQDFEVVVDYAHTADSLEKFYKIFDPKRHLIAVLGGTGGGRDADRRAVMGRLADTYCDEVILTDEDPYDEDPRTIIEDVAAGVKTKKPLIFMDRREAIREALKRAHTGDAVLITGKGTDPYIMGPRGTKTPWSDARVVREELEKLAK